MAKELDGIKVAVVVTDGFEQAEMTSPREALLKAGAEVVLLTPQGHKVQGMNHDEKGDVFPADKDLETAQARDYDGLVLPGGVANPDRLRTIPKAVQFVQEFFKENKPVAAICHGPWLLVEAGVVKGRTLTSWPSLQTDIRNAGGNWVDREVAADGRLVTSRKPADLPAFNRKVAEVFHAFAAERTGTRV